MVSLKTVALIEKRHDISVDLFRRYWRDVHGVKAARIAGFNRYVQYHLQPEHGQTHDFSGIALVSFKSQNDRGGLIDSPISRHIQRDEHNVFHRALLYNLEVGAYRSIAETACEDAAYQYFALVPNQSNFEEVQSVISNCHPTAVKRYNLTSGDPSLWNKEDALKGGSESHFAALFHIGLSDMSRQYDLKDAARSIFSLYEVQKHYVMVADGRPTHLGLRGADALRTIDEIGAHNQLDDEVIADVFGRQFISSFLANQ